MRILAIESSARPASALLWEDGRVVSSAYRDCGLNHSRTLLPLCEDVLRAAELALSDAQLIAVSAGPGSFTGVRIGVATAKGIAAASGAATAAVSSLLALACNACVQEGMLLRPCVDARCGRVYTALFRVENGFPRRLEEDAVRELSELPLPTEPTLLVGDGAHLLPPAELWRVAPENLRTANAYGVALAAASLPELTVPAERLCPIYLQPSQAERNRAK